MDWSNILSSFVTMVVGGGLGSIVTLKTTKKRKEFELLNDQLTKEMERNKELIQINIDKENRFNEQTGRLREYQNLELELNKQILALTQKVGLLQLELAMKRCEIHTCPWRQPPTATTPPPPDIDKDEWHRQRMITTISDQ